MTPPTMTWEQVQEQIKALNQRADALSQTQPYYRCWACDRVYPDYREYSSCNGVHHQTRNSRCSLVKAEGYQVIAHLAKELR